MLHGERLKPPAYVYPADEWKLIEQRFYPRFLAQMETMFSVGNGYLGMRGNFEEGTPAFQSGTFVNGFYETRPIVYDEEAYGFAKTGQTMVKVPDGKIIGLYVDDEPFTLSTASLIAFKRVLDMRAGTLDREVLWETPSGKRVSIRSRRLVSLEHRHLAAVSYQVTVLNASAPLVICSELRHDPNHEIAENNDPRRTRGFAEQVLLPVERRSEESRILLGYQAKSSGMRLACGVDHVMETECPYTRQAQCSDSSGEVLFDIDAKPGKPIHLTKYVTYHTSSDAEIEELCRRGHRTLSRAVSHGFRVLLDEQQEYLDDFWERSDVEASGDASRTVYRTPLELQQAMRWNLFQLLQASARAETTGIPAKGLTGMGYEGHYFWDTEIYVLPFLTYTAPGIARNLLKFRYNMLDLARRRAREVNQKGALFPWRTINGEEASAYYAAGTAQYHINADIMYALKRYVDVTGDKELLFREGAEMLVETARLWCDLGFFSERKGGRFCIHGVTGPDEYNTVVDNNTYTNLMARENLWYAVETVELLKNEKPERFVELVDKTGLVMSEVEQWKNAADHMYIPFDEKMGVHPQDDSFLEKKRWDFENTPRHKYPLLLFYHPLVIYRHKVIKQADIVLAMFLLGHEFSLEQKKLNFDYYDPLTTGDSSLSVGIQSILAFEIGDMDKAAEYGRYAVLMDMGDVGGNVRDGCHIASMGATWMVCTYGLAGMRDYNGELSFNPRPPEQIDRLRFRLRICDRKLKVDIDQESTIYTLIQGEDLVVRHGAQPVRLTKDDPVRRCSLPAPVNWKGKE